MDDLGTRRHGADVLLYRPEDRAKHRGQRHHQRGPRHGLYRQHGPDLHRLSTYEGTLPAADCPGIKTVLTIHADSTYQLTQDYLERKDGHDEASGVLRVLDGKVLVLERPSSGEQTYYKVKDDQHVVMTDSLGNEPEGETAKLYVLTKTK